MDDAFAKWGDLLPREVQEKMEQYEETVKLQAQIIEEQKAQNKQYEETNKLQALIIEQQKEIIKLQEQRAKLLQLQCDVLEHELGFKAESEVASAPV